MSSDTNAHTAIVPWDLLLCPAQQAGTAEPAGGTTLALTSLRVSLWASVGHQRVALLPVPLLPHAIKQPQSDVPPISLSGGLLAKRWQMPPWLVILCLPGGIRYCCPVTCWALTHPQAHGTQVSLVSLLATARRTPVTHVLIKARLWQSCDTRYNEGSNCREEINKNVESHCWIR